MCLSTLLKFLHYVYTKHLPWAGQNTYFHNKTIMYLSSMNNIHIIHGIQYLQNIKYNTAAACNFLKLIFCMLTMQQGQFPHLYQFQSPGILGKKICFTYTLKPETLGLNLQECFQVHRHQLPVLLGAFHSASHPVTRRLGKDAGRGRIAKFCSSIIFLLVHFTQKR